MVNAQPLQNAMSIASKLCTTQYFEPAVAVMQRPALLTATMGRRWNQFCRRHIE